MSYYGKQYGQPNYGPDDSGLLPSRPTDITRPMLGNWARGVALITGLFLATCGPIGVVYEDGRALFGYINLGIGLLLILIEWRPNAALDKLMRLTDVYPVKGVMYGAAAVPAFFQVPTMFGGLCLGIAAVMYLMAGWRRETWAAEKDS